MALVFKPILGSLLHHVPAHYPSTAVHQSGYTADWCPFGAISFASQGRPDRSWPSRTMAPAVGEIFEIVRPISIRRHFTRRPESPRKVVALVKVVGIDGDPGALVHVLRGSVTKGYWAERVEEDRIAALLYRSLNVLGFFSIVFHDLA